MQLVRGALFSKIKFQALGGTTCLVPRVKTRVLAQSLLYTEWWLISRRRKIRGGDKNKRVRLTHNGRLFWSGLTLHTKAVGTTYYVNFLPLHPLYLQKKKKRLAVKHWHKAGAKTKTNGTSLSPNHPFIHIIVVTAEAQLGGKSTISRC